MKIEMHTTLRRLRREHGVTQEQLAEHLCITAQAVGKWERGESLPDITLLPAIALYFGVRVDDLLGVGEARVQAQIDEWCRRSREYTNKGECEKDVALWEEAYREMPKNHQVKRLLMNALFFLACTNHKKYEAYFHRIVTLGEELLTECTDPDLRRSAIQTLCYTQNTLGNKEEAMRYACMQGDYYTTAAEMLSSVKEGEEAVEQCQWNLLSLTSLLDSNAWTMSWKGTYTPEEKARIFTFCIDAYKRLFEDGDYGFYACRISQRQQDLAFQYAKLGKREECLAALREAAETAVQFDTRGVTERTSLFADRCTDDPKHSTKNHTDNECRRRLDALENTVFDFVRGDAAFASLRDLLAAHASA